MSRGPKAVALAVSEPERAELQRLLRRHGTGQALAQPVRIVLACAEPGATNLGVATALGGSRQTVALWSTRAMVDLGLNHFEGRSWIGLHRHALMACIACAYLQHLRLAEPAPTGRGKKGGWPAGTTTVPEPAGYAAGHHRAAVRGAHPARAMPALPAPLPATV